MFCDLPVYDPGLFTSVDSLLPALVILLSGTPIVLLPALPGIVYVSALPLIFLTLLFDHCLFDPV